MDYREAYQNHTRQNKVQDFNIPKELDLTHCRTVMDIGCGDGKRTLEFLQWFMEKPKVRGYDIDEAWKPYWKKTLQDYDAVWGDMQAADLVHCSHAVYYPDVRQQILGIECDVLAIRGFKSSNYIKDVLEAIGRDSTVSWEEGLSPTFKVDIPVLVDLPVTMLDDYALWIKTYLEYEGPQEKIEDVLRKHTSSGRLKLDNSDVTYFMM